MRWWGRMRAARQEPRRTSIGCWWRHNISPQSPYRPASSSTVYNGRTTGARVNDGKPIFLILTLLEISYKVNVTVWERRVNISGRKWQKNAMRIGHRASPGTGSACGQLRPRYNRCHSRRSRRGACGRHGSSAAYAESQDHLGRVREK
jgi:hypothetical protein